ncbi:MAG: chorismate-binding protein [Methanomassiliicoccales archaeon]
MPPLELYKSLADDFDSSFILESAVGENRTVAFSFLGFGPQFIIRCRNGKVEGGEGFDDLREKPLEFLKNFIKSRQHNIRTFPLIGGLVGYFSYEFAKITESSFVGQLHPSFPEFELGYYQEGLIYDHSTFRVYYYGDDKSKLLKSIKQGLEPESPKVSTGPLRSITTKKSFESSVEDAKERILNGEAFQVVLSRALECNYSGNPLKFYESLRQENPSPYMFYLDFGKRKVLGSSPETLVSVKDKQVLTFPIAGTRPIGSSPKENRLLREEMLRDEKERAEHCMLVDLARNDLGKVCEIESVHVPEFMRVDSFSHVQHIVSKVEGILSGGKTAIDVLSAIFPAGTVSGAPKPRAMEIISSLERKPRGPYAGGVGYLSLNGNMDSAITIRSAFCYENLLTIQAGAGVVADSDPHREFMETEYKLGALFSALMKEEVRA